MASRSNHHEADERAGQRVHLVATNSDYGRMCQAIVERLTSGGGPKLDVVICEEWSLPERPARPRHLAAATCFISRVADIPERILAASRPSGESRYLLFAEGLPVEAIASRLPRLAIRDPRRLHVARKSDPRAIRAIAGRLIRGLARPNGPRRIVDAWVEGPMLALLSPSFERLLVPLEKLEPYIGRDPKQLAAFEIDEDGSFLYWPHADAHFGWEQLVALVDPTVSLAARQKSREFNRRYGAAIREMRVAAGLKQSDIAGVTERNLRRVEHGELRASRALLESLARAHGAQLDSYLKEVAEHARHA